MLVALARRLVTLHWRLKIRGRFEGGFSSGQKVRQIVHHCVQDKNELEAMLVDDQRAGGILHRVPHVLRTSVNTGRRMPLELNFNS